MDVEEQGIEGYMPDGDGVSKARSRLLHGAIVCSTTYTDDTIRTACTFCHRTCWRPTKSPPDYISVCIVCVVNILGPPKRKAYKDE